MAKSVHKRPAALTAGAIQLDFRECCARMFGREVRLTLTELVLLEALMRNPGVALRRSELLSLIGRTQHTNPRIIDVYVRRLRQKLHLDNECPPPIDAVRGVGYILREREEPRPPSQPPDPVKERDAKRRNLCMLIDSLTEEDLPLAEHYLQLLVKRHNGESSFGLITRSESGQRY